MNRLRLDVNAMYRSSRGDVFRGLPDLGRSRTVPVSSLRCLKRVIVHRTNFKLPRNLRNRHSTHQHANRQMTSL